MIRYLFWSYSAYLDRVHLTGGLLVTIPQCSSGFQCEERVLTARLSRVSSWLSDLSLFEEAWLHVVGAKLNWWWSVEVCLFTVGFWALHLRQQGKLNLISSIPYMILGQTVAISVAANLFNAAVATRQVTSPLSNPAEGGDGTARLEKKLLPQPKRSTTAENTRSVTTSQQFAHLSPPRFGNILFCSLMALVGLAVVDRVPSDLLSILLMHLCPILMILPIPLPSTIIPQSLRRVVSLSTLYAAIALISFAIRTKSHLDCWRERDRLITTALSHPAQSSISADAVCLVLTVVAELLEQYAQGKVRGSEALLLCGLTPLCGPTTTAAVACALTSRREERAQENSIWGPSEHTESLKGQDFLQTSTTVSTTFSLNGSDKSPTKARQRRQRKKD